MCDMKSYNGLEGHIPPVLTPDFVFSRFVYLHCSKDILIFCYILKIPWGKTLNELFAHFIKYFFVPCFWWSIYSFHCQSNRFELHAVQVIFFATFVLHFLRKGKVRCFTKDLRNHIMSYHAVQDSNFFFWYKV